MKRALIQMEEELYDQLRRKAFEEKKSISYLIRELVRKEISPPRRSRALSIKDFRFIGAGRSRQGSFQPVSERHDEALEEALRE